VAFRKEGSCSPRRARPINEQKITPMNKYNSRLLVSRRSYTVEELAKLYKRDVKTVFRWLKQGLEPMEKNTKPLLIMGDSVRLFFQSQKKRAKIKLKEGEYLCFKCRKAVFAKEGTTSTIMTGKKIGKVSRNQECLTGKCNDCGTKVFRLL
jgi:hypothetical protein